MPTEILTAAIDAVASGHDLPREQAAAVLAEIMDGNASETIDGSTTFAALDAQYDTVHLIATASEWIIADRDIA